MLNYANNRGDSMSKKEVAIRITKPDNLPSSSGLKKPFCNELNYMGPRKDTDFSNKYGLKPIFEHNPGVTIITSTIRQHCIDNVFTNYLSQNYETKELIVILNKNSMDIDVWREKAKPFNNIRIFKLDEKKSLGECINCAVSKAKYDFISKLDDDNFYASDFINGLINGFRYNEADIVGKGSYFVYFESNKTLAINCPNKENRYVNFLSGSALIIKKKVFKKVKFPELTLGEDTEFLKNCVKNGFKLYSTDRFNYVCIRRPNLDSHTWKVDEKGLIGRCEFVAQTCNFKKHIIR